MERCADMDFMQLLVDSLWGNDHNEVSSLHGWLGLFGSIMDSIASCAYRVSHWNIMTYMFMCKKWLKIHIADTSNFLSS